MKIRVEVDAELEHLVPGFLDARRQDIPRIAALLESGDSKALSQLGHRMAGAGGGYGFPFISEVGFRLEEAADAGARDAVQEAASALGDYLERVEVVYVVIPEEPEDPD